MTIDDLAAAAAERPDDAAAVQAWLEALGPDAARATALLPPLEAPFKIEREVRKHGVVARLEVSCADSGVAATRERFVVALRELLALPSLRLVQKLVISLRGLGDDDDLQPLVDALAAAPPSLRQLTLLCRNARNASAGRCDLGDLWGRLPRLVEVEVRCAATCLGDLPARLEALLVHGPLDDAALRALAAARLPSLARLQLALGKQRAELVAPLLAGDGVPALRDLYFDGAADADGVCHRMSAALAARLEDLSFENSGLTDIGAELLAEKPLKLRWLRLEGCGLSRDVRKLVEPLTEELTI
jgi:hypothetical protein